MCRFSIYPDALASHLSHSPEPSHTTLCITLIELVSSNIRIINHPPLNFPSSNQATMLLSNILPHGVLLPHSGDQPLPSPDSPSLQTSKPIAAATTEPPAAPTPTQTPTTQTHAPDFYTSLLNAFVLCLLVSVIWFRVAAKNFQIKAFTWDDCMYSCPIASSRGQGGTAKPR